MDWFSYLVAGVMVYVAVVVFVLGMAYRFYQWAKVPKTSVRLAVFPKPANRAAKWFVAVKNALIFPQVIEVDPKMWLFSMLFHLGLLGAFVGHLRLLHEFTPLVGALGSEGMERLSFWGWSTMGIVLSVAVVYLLVRRMKSPYKDVSVPEDYILLLLILAVVTMGNHLRFFGDVPTADYRAYLQSLLAFKPAFPAALAASSIKSALVLHVFLANLLLIYFPFGKLVHVVGTFATNLVRSD